MIADAIKKIIDLSEAKNSVTAVNGVFYAKHNLTRILESEQTAPQPLEFSTLTGLLHYIGANPDTLDLNSLFLMVDDEKQVSLNGIIQKNNCNMRFCYATSIMRSRLSFQFAHWYPLEDLIIAVKSQFVPTEDIDQIITALSNVADENIKMIRDSNSTQAVTVKTGIALKEFYEIKNRLDVKPFRTFSEIEQPASPAILRLRKNDNRIFGALFIADGDFWKLTAILQIKLWLEEQIGEKMPIFA